MSTVLEPLTEAGVHAGHDSLLETFREFVDAVDDRHANQSDPGVLRGAVAFLRQSLIPFARREEESLADSTVLADEIAFEHAFLAAETDALAADVERALDDVEGSAAREVLLRSIRRRIYRIEAVLELHVQKHLDRDPGAEREPDAPVPLPRSYGFCELTVDEIRHFMRTHKWGLLCTVGGDGEPYAVPVSYGFDGTEVYVATGPGKKARNMEVNPGVCLTVPDVESGGHWRSVVVTGHARGVESIREKLHALGVLARQRGHLPTRADLARMASSRVIRIEVSEMTGRSRD
jgi:uncharacterized protein